MIATVLASALLVASAPCDAASEPLTIDQVDARFRTLAHNLGYYPEAAAYRHVEGDVTIVCFIYKSGEVNRCKVESQTPAKAGFGAATIRYFIDSLVVGPVAKDGTPTAGRRIRLHKAWRIDGGAAYNLH